MKSSTRKILKWTGIVLGALLLVAVALGAYVYSLIPKPLGEVPALQSELFNPPATPLPVEGKYIYKTATELAGMIRRGEATSVEVVQEHINFIKNNNHKYNALVWLFEEEALAAAARADSLLALGTVLGPLHGVPMTVKEQYFMKGTSFTSSWKAACTLAMSGTFRTQTWDLAWGWGAIASATTHLITVTFRPPE